MLTMRDHDVDDYVALLDMDATDVGVLTKDDRECLKALGDYLVLNGAWQRFAIWLLHKHFDPDPGEVFIEQSLVSLRETVTSPRPACSSSATGLSVTAMRFSDADATGVDLIGMEFAALDDLGSAAPVSEADETVLAGVVAILRAHGKTDRFGVQLIRDRLRLGDEESLIETSDVERRVLYCEATERGLVPSGSIETSWRFEPDTGNSPSEICRTRCVVRTSCRPDPGAPGGHVGEIDHLGELHNHQS